jgi:hypothetical protein
VSLASLAWANLWSRPRRTIIACLTFAAASAALAAGSSLATPSPADTAHGSILLAGAMHGLAFAAAYAVMLSIAWERRAEHATLEALGMQQAQLTALLLLELAALAAVGIAVGGVAGALLADRGGPLAGLDARAAAAMMGLCGAALAGGMVPAVRAAAGTLQPPHAEMP